MKIDNLYIIDWYDNVITSIILSDNKKYFLNCININFIDNQKTYYCVELDNNSFDKILKIIKKSNLIKNDWNTINLILNKINSLDNIALLKTESLSVGTVIALQETNNIINIKLPVDISNFYENL
jgi:hypothetical protein